MLVADACSGLHSMYSLSALGTLFMYIMARMQQDPQRDHAGEHPADRLRRQHRARDRARLITYHLGDEAGQGFLHGAAGIVLMLVALVFFFALDALLPRILPDDEREPATARQRDRTADSAGAGWGGQAAELFARRAWHRGHQSATNFCCRRTPRVVSLSIDETRNGRPSGICPVRPRRISAIRLSNRCGFEVAKGCPAWPTGALQPASCRAREEEIPCGGLGSSTRRSHSSRDQVRASLIRR